MNNMDSLKSLLEAVLVSALREDSESKNDPRHCTGSSFVKYADVSDPEERMEGFLWQFCDNGLPGNLNPVYMECAFASHEDEFETDLQKAVDAGYVKRSEGGKRFRMTPLGALWLVSRKSDRKTFDIVVKELRDSIVETSMAVHAFDRGDVKPPSDDSGSAE